MSCLRHADSFLSLVRDATADGSRDVQALEKDVEDTTAANDVDSGLQMAVSPCSALSMTSVSSAAGHHKNDVAVSGTGTCGHAGIRQCHCSLTRELVQQFYFIDVFICQNVSGNDGVQFRCHALPVPAAGDEAT